MENAPGPGPTAPAVGAEPEPAPGPAADAGQASLIDAARRCIARWGVRKTSLDDIAREAGVARATVYRAFPGGKDRLMAAVWQHEADRVLQASEAALAGAATLEDLLTAGMVTAFGLIRDDEVLRAVLEHEPELILPHFAFHRLDGVLDLVAALGRPHLARFLPEAAIRPAADLVARTALTFGFRPPDWFDPRDPAAARQLVRTYLVPAITPPEEPPCPPTTS